MQTATQLVYAAFGGRANQAHTCNATRDTVTPHCDPGRARPRSDAIRVWEELVDVPSNLRLCEACGKSAELPPPMSGTPKGNEAHKPCMECGQIPMHLADGRCPDCARGGVRREENVEATNVDVGRVEAGRKMLATLARDIAGKDGEADAKKAASTVRLQALAQKVPGLTSLKCPDCDYVAASDRQLSGHRSGHARRDKATAKGLSTVHGDGPAASARRAGKAAGDGKDALRCPCGRTFHSPGGLGSHRASCPAAGGKKRRYRKQTVKAPRKLQEPRQAADRLKVAEARQGSQDAAEAAPDAPAKPVAPIDPEHGALIPDGRRVNLLTKQDVIDIRWALKTCLRSQTMNWGADEAVWLRYAEILGRLK